MAGRGAPLHAPRTGGIRNGHHRRIQAPLPVERVAARGCKDRSRRPGLRSGRCFGLLTDSEFFGGTLEDLQQASRLAALPLLRKDFIVDEYQLYQARTSGASAVLLIAAVLSPDECRRLARTAHELELEVLLEVHTPSELSQLNQYVDMLGVNNRDLGTFHTDVENSLRMIDLLRRETGGSEGPLLISESGISDPQTVLRLREAGFRGFLMGEAFMKTGDPGRALAEFVTRLKTPQP